MRLFEAIVDANHRAVAGDVSAGLHPDDFKDSLPVVALTCIDPRLNAFFPNALALPAEDFIWLRNAGNIVTGPLTSTMRSLALACAIKGGREIVIIGHTDCHVARTTTMVLLDKLMALGVDRSRLPENINEFFGTFGSERQNVIKGCDYIRHSPLIGPKIPVHGMLIDVATGKLDWVVNGYETLTAPGQKPMVNSSLPTMSDLGSFANFAMGEMKFPDLKIGDTAFSARSPADPSVTTPSLEAETGSDSTPPQPPPLPKATLPPVRMKTAPPPISPNRPYPGFKLK